MLRAKETVHIGTDDGTRTIAKGDLVEDGDADIKGLGDLFESADDSEQKPARQRRTQSKPAARKAE